MSTKFEVQVYDPESYRNEMPTPALGSQTDSSQADSVRSILQRFAVTGIATGRDPSKDSYIGRMDEDTDIDAPENRQNVNDMLDTPDLSMMDEMEIKDYIADNITFTENPRDTPDGEYGHSSSAENNPADPE